jgi:hypothetical protein
LFIYLFGHASIIFNIYNLIYNLNKKIKIYIYIASLTSNYLGCYDDGINGARDLNGSTFDDLRSMKKQLCLNKCSKDGYKYFGLQYGLV